MWLTEHANPTRLKRGSCASVLSDNGLFRSNGVLNLGNRLRGIARHLLLFSLGQGPRNEIKNIDTRFEDRPRYQWLAKYGI
jgi:hypothetical protein